MYITRVDNFPWII